MKKSIPLLVVSLMTLPTLTLAEAIARGTQLDVEVHKVNQDGIGESIGTIRVARHEDGVLFEPDLEGLEPGLHGFHLHENPDCRTAQKDGKTTPAGAAGGHLDPNGTGEHNGPYESGHLGDLPPLYADDNGKVSIHVLAPRLEFGQVVNHALVIHANGDNYSDEPKPLGGGGARVACGVVAPD